MKTEHIFLQCFGNFSVSSLQVESSKKLPVKSSVRKQTIKVPHNKESSNLRDLPPLWSVSIVPGSGVKLKFTLIDPKKKNPYQFDTDDCSD